MKNRWLVALVVISILSTASCADCDQLPPNTAIRVIDRLEELDVASDNKSTVAITANDGYGCAKQQAREWDPDATLIYVTVRTWVIPAAAGKEIEATAWLYVFKNDTQDSWLGIIVDRNGIVDAGKRLPNGYKLSDWPKISRWNTDSDETFLPNRIKGMDTLEAIELDGKTIPIWYEQQSLLVGVAGYIDARNGSRFEGLERRRVYNRLSSGRTYLGKSR